MAKKNQHEKQDFLRELSRSPLRIGILIIALLVLSLAGGALIGELVKHDGITNTANVEPVTGLNSAKSVPAVEEPAYQPTVSAAPKPVSAIETEAEAKPEKKPEEKPKSKPISKPDDPVRLALIPPTIKERKSTKEQPVPGLPAWKKYAVTSALQEERPRIALVIDDVGLNARRIDDLLLLPEVATISFLPYAHNLQRKVDKIRKAGHEIMLHLPMEPTSKAEDPGPNALYKSYSKDELTRLTHYNLNVFKNYVGVNNHMGSGFTTDSAAMGIVLDILRDEGLLFLDSRTIGSSVGYKLAKTKNIPTAQRDIFLDNYIEAGNITAQLLKTEALARGSGLAIAIGHPHKLTISMLQKWMPEAVRRGFQFIPVSMAVEFNEQTATN